jgi:hypothetical protein
VNSRWIVIDDDGYVWDYNHEVGCDWTGPEALRQALFAQADGADVIAVLVVEDYGSAYFMDHGQLYVMAMPADGHLSRTEAVPVDEEHARSKGVAIDEIRSALKGQP